MGMLLPDEEEVNALLRLLLLLLRLEGKVLEVPKVPPPPPPILLLALKALLPPAGKAPDDPARFLSSDLSMPLLMLPSTVFPARLVLISFVRLGPKLSNSGPATEPAWLLLPPMAGGPRLTLSKPPVVPETRQGSMK